MDGFLVLDDLLSPAYLSIQVYLIAHLGVPNWAYSLAFAIIQSRCKGTTIFVLWQISGIELGRFSAPIREISESTLLRYPGYIVT